MIGLALPVSAGAPAPYEERDDYAVASGQAVVELIRRNLRPRDIVTLRGAGECRGHRGRHRRVAPMPALHLPAMAHEAGIRFTLQDVAEIMRKHAAHRRPQAGREIRRGGRATASAACR